MEQPEHGTETDTATDGGAPPAVETEAEMQATASSLPPVTEQATEPGTVPGSRTATGTETDTTGLPVAFPPNRFDARHPMFNASVSLAVAQRRLHIAQESIAEGYLYGYSVAYGSILSAQKNLADAAAAMFDNLTKAHSYDRHQNEETRF